MVQNGVVRGLDPNRFSALSYAFEFVGELYPLTKLLLELAVLDTSLISVLNKHTVMLAFYLLKAITHGSSEILIGVKNLSFQIKLNESLRFVDRIDLPFEIGIAQFSLRNVSGKLDQMLSKIRAEKPETRKNSSQDAITPTLLIITTFLNAPCK